MGEETRRTGLEARFLLVTGQGKGSQGRGEVVCDGEGECMLPTHLVSLREGAFRRVHTFM